MEENTETPVIKEESEIGQPLEGTPKESGTYEKKPYNREKKPYNREEGGFSGGGFRKGKFGNNFKRKKCRFCGKEKKAVDKDLNYKNIDLLEKFVSDRGKLLPARISGNCAIHQRKVKVEVKKARYMALLPFARVEKINK